MEDIRIECPSLVTELLNTTTPVHVPYTFPYHEEETYHYGCHHCLNLCISAAGHMVFSVYPNSRLLDVQYSILSRFAGYYQVIEKTSACSGLSELRSLNELGIGREGLQLWYRSPWIDMIT